MRGLETADLSWVVALEGIRTNQALEEHKDWDKILTTKEDVRAWAQELGDVNFSYTDLSEVSLEASRLEGCLFCGADLRLASFSRAVLTHADFSGAELVKADLSGAELTEAVFRDADMRGANLSGVDLGAIKSALLAAKSLVGVTCTLGTVPAELKARGVLDSEERASVRMNPQAVDEADKRLRDERARRLAFEQQQKRLEHERAITDRLDAALQGLVVPEVAGADMPLLRLRLLQGVLRERTALPFPLDSDERCERWEAFAQVAFPWAAPAITATASPLPRIYGQLIGEETKDACVVALWRRTRQSATATATASFPQRPGTLADMCIEAMLRARPWSAWAQDVAAAFPSESGRGGYIRELFRKDAAASLQQEQPQQQQQQQQQQQTPLSLHPRIKAGGYKKLSSSLPRLPLTQQASQNSASPRTPVIGAATTATTATTTAIGSGNGSGCGSGSGAMLSSPPVCYSYSYSYSSSCSSPSSCSPSSSCYSPPPPSSLSSCYSSSSATVPSTSSSSSAVTMGMGMGMGMNAMPQPSVMNLTQSTSFRGTHQSLRFQYPNYQQQQQLQQQQQQQQQQQFQYQSHRSAGNLRYNTNMGMGNGMNMNMNMNTMPNNGMSTMNMGITMGMNAGMGNAPNMGMGNGNGNGNLVQCADCKLVFERSNAEYHKKTCAMRWVACSTCRYKMRFVHWANHKRYCNTAGACPLCGVTIKSNVVIHLYETHSDALKMNGFFNGVEPPVRMK